MASPPTYARYKGPNKELYGLAGVAYIPTCLGSKKCWEELRARGRTEENYVSFVPSIQSEPHFNEEFFVGLHDVVWGDKHVWEEEEYPELSDDDDEYHAYVGNGYDDCEICGHGEALHLELTDE